MDSKRKAVLEMPRNNVTRRKTNQAPVISVTDKYYRPSSQKTDLPADEYEEAKKQLLHKLPSTAEHGTFLQRDGERWEEVRRRVLTASNFGTVCRLLPNTPCVKLVVTLDEVETKLSVEIKPCGMFLDQDIRYLGATPNGIIYSYGIVEVKCPSLAKFISHDDATLSRKFTFWTVKKKKSVDVINKKHKCYYQIQSQLHVP
ncbi:hypothetical protein PR048_005836 [Dryococelus australis]|uniref:YqaJ viral recombinase domain-containing protein n=1 Tax=Dryococelus australis TaxID=614101 RepID=A0ABQ9I9C1_9NEOP|nr:hypothetical protein PR048_005836 [Dryococelus australis]